MEDDPKYGVVCIQAILHISDIQFGMEFFVLWYFIYFCPLSLLQQRLEKLREATYTAAVCKLLGWGTFLLFLVWFRVWHSSVQPLCISFISIDVDISTIFCLRGTHRPRPQ